MSFALYFETLIFFYGLNHSTVHNFLEVMVARDSRSRRKPLLMKWATPEGDKRTEFLRNTQEIMALCDRYNKGSKGRLIELLIKILKEYERVESRFDISDPDQKTEVEAAVTFEIAIEKMLHDIQPWPEDKKKDYFTDLVNDVIAFHQSKNRSSLIAKLIKVIRTNIESDFIKNNKNMELTLTKMTELSLNLYHRKVALEARKALMESYQKSYEERKNWLERGIIRFIQMGALEMDVGNDSDSSLHEIILSESAIFDVIPEFFYHENIGVRTTALEIYVQRSYLAYEVSEIEPFELDGSEVALRFVFTLPKNHYNINKHSEEANNNLNDSGRFRTLSGINKLKNNTPRSRYASMSQTAASKGEPQARISGNKTNMPSPFANDHLSSDRVRSLSSSDSFEESLAENDNDRICWMACYNSLEDCKKGLFPLFNRLLDYQENQLNVYGFADANNIAASPIASYFFDRRQDQHDTPENVNPSVCLYFVIKNTGLPDNCNSEEMKAQLLSEVVKENLNTFLTHNIKRVTFIIHKERSMPFYFTFRCPEFTEDDKYRNLEPGLAFQLELQRLKNFRIIRQPSTNRKLQLYLGKAKSKDADKTVNISVEDQRYFLRAIIRHTDFTEPTDCIKYLKKEGERVILEAMDELDLALRTNNKIKTDCNHIFLNFVPTYNIDPIILIKELKRLIYSYGDRLWKMRITGAEIKFNIQTSPEEVPLALRICLGSENGFYLNCDVYEEIFNEASNNYKFQTFKGYRHTEPNMKVCRSRINLDGMRIDEPYPTRTKLQIKRYQAQTAGSQYCYDILDLFENSIQMLWEDYHAINNIKSNTADNTAGPTEKITYEELTLDAEGKLTVINSFVASNKIGMVAWKICIKTPDSPNGRIFFLIANDITFIQGSFGSKENDLYTKVSEEARRLKVPRIYFSVNVGARLGLVKEIQSCFKVEWKDSNNINQGHEYLYLTPADYTKYSKYVIAEHVQVGHESRYKITAIVNGPEATYGIQSLSYSAASAGETSKAYDEIMTINIVSCRSIGIGAYIVRLGQRVIQVENSFIVLTGYQALNSLLGKEVYTGNSQLGGTQINHPNGVAHSIVKSDLESVMQALQWMCMTPEKSDGYSFNELPYTKDPIDRTVDWAPSKGLAYDPMEMFDGGIIDGKRLKGIADENTWHEIMDGWAKTIVPITLVVTVVQPRQGPL